MAADPEVIWRGDLAKVYVDPLVAPGVPLAYVPEQHASPRCERALKRGRPDQVPDPDAPWCGMCTTANAAEATMRRDENGRWQHTTGRP